jgi:hypothetical protein
LSLAKQNETIIGVKSIKRWLDWPPWLTFPLIFLLFLIVSFKVLDPDFGWHLASGQYFLENGLPVHDIFTFTASEFPWIDHEWLSDILLASLYSVGGYLTLVVFYSGLWTGAFYLVGRRALGAVVLAAAVAALPFAGVRAITWTMVGLAVLIRLLAAKNQRWWLALPLVVGLWANLHGSFVVGLAVIGFYALTRRSLKLAAIGLMSGLASLINPYGPAIYIEVWRTLSDTSLHSSIGEWRSFLVKKSTMLILALYGSGLIWAKKRWTSFVNLPNILLLASLSAQRNWPLFALSAIDLTDHNIRAMVSTLPAKLNRAGRRIFGLIGLILLGMTVWGLSATPIIESGWQRDSEYPRVAAWSLRENPCPGHLFNDYNIGGYLIWQLPETKVYIDGRMPSWSFEGKNYFHTYREVVSQKAVRDAEFARYDIKCALISSDSEVAEDLKSDKSWLFDVDDGTYSLFRRD